jgi:hypothetical protein
MLAVVKPGLPPEALLLEARLQTGERWALFAFLLILVGVVGLSKGMPGLIALLVLCGSGAASTIAAWYIVPAFVRLRRIAKGRSRNGNRR